MEAKSQAQTILVRDSLELDSTIRYGQLANGFTYYIKDLSEPQPKLYMNLYTKAGYNHSEKNEPNIAHAVEHLAYKATKDFPNGISQSDEMSKLGMSLYDYSGVTSTKLTEYFFNAPAHSPEALKVGLLFFRNIADGLLIRDDDLKSVKGELRQEYLLKTEDEKKRDATVKLVSEIYPCTQDSSNFLSKLEKMDPESVHKFYNDYYRPDLLAVSIIGNIEDLDELESKIKKTFSDLKNPTHPKKLKDCASIYYNSPPDFHVVEQELNSSKAVPNTAVNIQLYYRDPKTYFNLFNYQGLERVILTELVTNVLDSRFSQISNGYSSFTVFNKNLYKEDMLGGLLMEAEVNDSEVKETFQKILKGVFQLQKNGVSQEEFQKLKSNYSRLISNKNVKDPRYWRDQIVANYIIEEALPKQKKQLQLDILFDLSINEFNEFIADFLSSGPQDIGIIAPTGNKALLFKEHEIRSWIEEQQESKMDLFSYSKAPKDLLFIDQKNSLKENIPYKVKSKTPEIKEYYLQNGLKLIVQAVEPGAKNDIGMFVINGFSKKGACEIPEEFLFSALYSADIVLNSGVNDFSKLEVEQYMREQGLFPGVLSFYVDHFDSGIQAFASVDKLETVLQLLYLYLTKPNKSDAAYEEWKENKYKSSSNLVVNQFHQAVKRNTEDPKFIEDYFGRKGLPEGLKFSKGVEETDLDQALMYFEKFFGSAKDFTLVVSGDFKIDSVMPILVKYLGNLPSGSLMETNCVERIGKNLSKGPKMFKIPAPPNVDLQNVKYGWKFVKDAAKTDDWHEQLQVEVLAELTNIRGWDLRYKQGYSIYDVRVVGELNKDLSRYEISSYLDLIPEQYPAVKAEVHKIFKELRTELVSEENLEKAVKYVVSNRYKLDGGSRAIQKRNEMLFDHYRYGLELTTPTEMKLYLESLTPKDMRRFAKKLYQKKYLYEFVMKGNNL